jgi:predicted enzyme related to lactoylglutathione lyase
MDVPGMEYTIVRTVPVDDNNMPKEKGAINGGMMKRTTSGEMPVLVINVPSIDRYIEKITDAGGKVVMPEQGNGNGSYARVTIPRVTSSHRQDLKR